MKILEIVRDSVLHISPTRQWLEIIPYNFCIRCGHEASPLHDLFPWFIIICVAVPR